MTDLQIVDTVVPLSKCCECGHQSDRAEGINTTPSPGDYTLCIRCACLNIFDENLVLRAPNDDEIFAAAADSEVQLLRRIIMILNTSFAGRA